MSLPSLAGEAPLPVYRGSCAVLAARLAFCQWRPAGTRVRRALSKHACALAPDLPCPAAYKRVTAPEDWSLGAPMTDFRMRHAHGLQEMWAQLRRHFLHQPLQAPPAAGAAAAAGGAAAEPAEPAPQQAGQQRSEGRQQALEEQLARLAAGSAALAGVFDAATAEGRNPVDAVSAAAAAAAAAAASGPPAGEEMGAAQEGPPPPPAEASAEQRFAAATYLTQLQQALAYQTAVHQWRRNRGDARAQARSAREALHAQRCRGAAQPPAQPSSPHPPAADDGSALLAAARCLGGALVEQHQR